MIIGNVGEEPRFTSTNSGNSVCTFSIATNRSWLPKGETERREETQWHNVVVFSKLAEICSQILTRGTKVFISGRIKSRRITNLLGEEIKTTEIVGLNVLALDKRKSNPVFFSNKEGVIKEKIAKKVEFKNEKR